MSQTVEAVIEPNGTVRLLQPIHVTKPTRAMLTVAEPEDATSSPGTGDRPPPRTLEEALQRMSEAKTSKELFAAAAAAAPFQVEPEGYDIHQALIENRKVPFCRPANWKEWGYDDE